MSTDGNRTGKEDPMDAGLLVAILIVLAFVLPYATAIYLAIRLRAHANTVPATR